MSRPSTAARHFRPDWSRMGQVLWPLLALCVLIGVNIAISPRFGHVWIADGRLHGSLIDIAYRAAPLVLVTIGMTLVIATGGIDLSVGSVMAIGASLAAGLAMKPSFSVLSDVPFPDSSLAAIAVALVGVSLLGAFNGMMVTVFRVQPIIATLVLMVAGKGIAQLLADGQTIPMGGAVFGFLGSGEVMLLPVSVLIWFVAFGVVGIAARLTAAGLFLESVGSNRSAARLSGVRVRFAPFLAYVLVAFLSGVAGILEACDTTVADANNIGEYMELDAILAVVIGGTALTGGRFSLLGAVIGALLIQALTTTILSRGVPVEATLIFKSGIVIAVCLLQSQRFRDRVIGLLPRSGRRTT